MRKSNLNERVTTRPASKYVERDVTLEGVSCNTDLVFILVTWIPTAGVTQDRYRGEAYSFTRENWIRVFAYYSESMIKTREMQGWISDMGINGPTFVPKSGYCLLILVKVCPQKLAFSSFFSQFYELAFLTKCWLF